MLLLLIYSVVCPTQRGETQTGATAPLAMPSTSGVITTASPKIVNAGPLGNIDVTGILSGFGYSQNHPSAGDRITLGDVSNGQVFVQKASGLFQYFLQAGVYNIPILGIPGISTRATVDSFYGPLPQAYLKIAPKDNFSFLIGKLPTLIGAEYTFSFENLNIERGILWNQENAISRGIQINYGKDKFTGSLSWNDGFYSNRYNWLSGTVTYSLNQQNTLQVTGGGNLGNTPYSTTATPLYQNNGSIYNVIYTYTAKRWMLEPYFQYTRVPANLNIGTSHNSSTIGSAVIANYNFTSHISLAERGEYIASTGDARDGAANLLYGAGSQAWSITLTPTFHDNAFFVRGEFSFSHANNQTPGDVFGPEGINPAQVRGLVETGLMF